MWPGQPKDQRFDFSKLKQPHLCLVDDTVYNLALSLIQSVTEPSGSIRKGFLEDMYVEGHRKDRTVPGESGRSPGHQGLGNVNEQTGCGCRQPKSRWGGGPRRPP